MSKDGVALAKEYTSRSRSFPSSSSNHGTTLVEYFYHQACVQKDKKRARPARHRRRAVSATPGPKPKSKEICQS